MAKILFDGKEVEVIPAGRAFGSSIFTAAPGETGIPQGLFFRKEGDRFIPGSVRAGDPESFTKKTGFDAGTLIPPPIPPTIGEQQRERIEKIRSVFPIPFSDLPPPLPFNIQDVQFSPGVQAQQAFAQQIVPTFPQQALSAFTSQGQGQFPGQFPGQAPGQAPAQFPAQAQAQQGKPLSFTKRGPPTVASSEQGVIAQAPQQGAGIGSKSGRTGTSTTSTTV